MLELGFQHKVNEVEVTGMISFLCILAQTLPSALWLPAKADKPLVTKRIQAKEESSNSKHNKRRPATWVQDEQTPSIAQSRAADKLNDQVRVQNYLHRLTITPGEC